MWVFISKKCASHFRRETANESKYFREIKSLLSNLYLIEQRFQGYDCTSYSHTVPSLQGGSLEILLTVPLNWRLECSIVDFRVKRLRDFLGFKVTLKYRFYRLKIDYIYYNFNLARRGLFLFSKVKGTVSVISSDSSCKDGNARLTTIPSKPLSDYNIYYFCEFLHW